LHGIDGTGLNEVRRVIECAAAGLAAERATGDQLAAISDEVIGMYSTLEEPEAFSAHDAGFHRAVAAGANNPVLAAIGGMVTSLHFEQRQAAMACTAGGLHQTADKHRRIYLAIRRRDVEGARAAMDAYLQCGQPLGSS
jgi:GntR family transcriptional repressor for pyruvate dehydrogenase complex